MPVGSNKGVKQLFRQRCLPQHLSFLQLFSPANVTLFSSCCDLFVTAVVTVSFFSVAMITVGYGCHHFQPPYVSFPLHFKSLCLHLQLHFLFNECSMVNEVPTCGGFGNVNSLVSNVVNKPCDLFHEKCN